MSSAKKQLDMLNGSILNKLPLYALPVAATGILEQLFNASDIAIVGNFASTDKTAAIAAVGANTPIIGMLLNLFIGISLGTNVIISNAIGRGDNKTVQKAVHTSIITALIGVCAVRIVWVYTYFAAHRSFGALMMAYPISLSTTAVLIFIALMIYRPSIKLGK